MCNLNLTKSGQSDFRSIMPFTRYKVYKLTFSFLNKIIFSVSKKKNPSKIVKTFVRLCHDEWIHTIKRKNEPEMFQQHTSLTGGAPLTMGVRCQLGMRNIREKEIDRVLVYSSAITIIMLSQSIFNRRFFVFTSTSSRFLHTLLNVKPYNLVLAHHRQIDTFLATTYSFQLGMSNRCSFNKSEWF